jgi:hypothetical protein
MHEDLPPIPDDPETALSQLAQFKAALDLVLRSIIIDGVTDRLITRKRAAEIIDVHPLTISRWIAAHEINKDTD